MKVLTLDPAPETGLIGFTLFKLKNMFTDTTLNKLALDFVMCAICCPPDNSPHIDVRAMLKLAAHTHVWLNPLKRTCLPGHN